MIRTTVAALVAALSFVTPALAKGGSVTFVGGNPLQQQTVTDALRVSSFDFGQLPQTITVRIVPSLPASESGEAVPGTVTLGADFLDQGMFAFGTIQHEFAHEVDYLLLSDAQRQQALKVLGADEWYDASLRHADQGRERFATTLAWTFWQVAMNNQSPRYKSVEAQNSDKFRALLASWGLASKSAPICRQVKVKRGYYDARHRWHKPRYKKICA